MKMRWKKAAATGICLSMVATFVLTSSFTLTGCKGDHGVFTREEIEDYVKENTPITDFTVSSESKTVEGNAYWTVQENGGAELMFHVVDEEESGLFSVTHILLSDYDHAAMEHLIDQYDGFQLLQPYYNIQEARGIADDEEIADDVADDAPVRPAFSDTEDVYVVLAGSFDSRDGLDALSDEAEAFFEYVQASDYPSCCDIVFRMESSVREMIPDQVQDDGDYEAYSVESFDETKRKAALETCLLLAVDYRLQDWLDQFTEDEIEEAVQSATTHQAIGICRGNAERDEYEFYPDLAGARYTGGIGVRTLHEILTREGFQVSGDAEAYSFTGADGSTYEFATAWTDGSEDKAHCYYKKDGETVGLPDSRIQHLTTEDIKEITGLQLILRNYGDQPNANVYTESGHVRKLDRIFLNGEQMTYDTVSDGSFFAHTTDDYCYAYYDEERDTYVMVADVGWRTDSMSYPVIIEEWVQALGGTYEGAEERDRFGGGSFRTKWTVGGDTYVMRAKSGSDDVSRFQVKKNGKQLDLDWFADEEHSSFPKWLIGLPVDDFAKLFGLSVEVNEEEGAVYFAN